MFNTFGNKVRIRKTEETESKGLANKEGIIYGHTTPSAMDVDVIGIPKEDLAINVHFEDLDTSYWFSNELLENIHNGEGAVISLDGIDKKWTKNEEGQWIEESLSEKTKWWQFWK